MHMIMPVMNGNTYLVFPYCQVCFMLIICLAVFMHPFHFESHIKLNTNILK